MWTGTAVMVPWRCCPSNISRSRVSKVTAPWRRANSAATIWLRPLMHVVMRSAKQQLSQKTRSGTSKNSRMKPFISFMPMRINAATVLDDIPMPSRMPFPMATMFLRAPHIWGPSTFLTVATGKKGRETTGCSQMRSSRFLQPSVDSLNCPKATSFAMLAPMRQQTCDEGNPSSWATTSVTGKSLPSANSTPLASKMSLADLFRNGFIFWHVGTMYWSGTPTTTRSAPAMAVSMSGSAFRLSGSFTPGKYLTFSLSLLMMVLSLVPKPPCGIVTGPDLLPVVNSRMPYMSCSVSTASSKICMSTSLCQSFRISVFCATNIATVFPQEPLPTAAARHGLSPTTLSGLVVVSLALVLA
mmetsp:Transcript_112813/g.299695  ORF Transcript_112813/g.299695 Transcript_112813/m.299695 type:complete len:356 (+) Transcript_112813:299-1366(+)